MTWLAWRQYRTELLIGLALLAAITAFLIPTGLTKLSEFHSSGLSACVSSDEVCQDLRSALAQKYTDLSPIVFYFNLVPAVVGILLAAPLISELETRTTRLAWTQSISRERWLATKLGAAFLGALAFSIVFTLLMTWWYAPFDHSALVGKDVGLSFDFEGVMPFVHTLFAFGVALLVGVWSRSLLGTVPVTIVAFFVALVGELMLRESPAKPAPAGRLVEAGALPLRDMTHFWTLQGTEAAIFVTAALVLTGLAAGLVRQTA